MSHERSVGIRERGDPEPLIEAPFRAVPLTRVLRLTLLPPDIVEAILDGRQGPEVPEARAEIEAADEAIVRVAQTLPDEGRVEVARARKSLAARIMSLAKYMPEQARAAAAARGSG